MITIRNYKKSDFAMISGWWKKANEIGPLETMLPPESSFVAEIDNVPSLCVSLYLTNITEFCYAENFIGNPEMKGTLRREASHVLAKHVEGFAKNRGYKRLLCMAHKGPVKHRYEELGYSRTLDDVTTFCRILE